MKIIKEFTRVIGQHTSSIISLWLMPMISFSDGIIPTSSDEETTSGSSVITTLINMAQKEFIPLVMILGAISILGICIHSLVGGVKDARAMKSFDPLKDALIEIGIVMAAGGTILYLLNMARSYTF